MNWSLARLFFVRVVGGLSEVGSLIAGFSLVFHSHLHFVYYLDSHTDKKSRSVQCIYSLSQTLSLTSFPPLNARNTASIRFLASAFNCTQHIFTNTLK